MPRAAPSLATDAPLRPGQVRLAVRDLPRMRDFYERALGLATLDQGPAHAALGVGSLTLLHLQTRPGLIAADARAAGLFHAAFLMPDRASLAAWAIHAARSGVPLAGASDHIVSEAIYLSDPEGNGLEVCADRPPERWRGPDGAIRMSTGPLDLEDLAAAATAAWNGFPPAGRLGHVHLQVGALAEADRFWQGVIGMGLTTSYPGASFYASGGYHHHIAANVWNSRHAPPRDETLAGLDAVRIVARNEDGLAKTIARAERAGLTPEWMDGVARLRDPFAIKVEIAIEGGHAD